MSVPLCRTERFAEDKEMGLQGREGASRLMIGTLRRLQHGHGHSLHSLLGLEQPETALLVPSWPGGMEGSQANQVGSIP